MHSEFKYDKNSLHLPMFGIGPLYVFAIGICSVLAVLLDRMGVLPSIRPSWGRFLFIVLGLVSALFGIFLWAKAVLKDRVDDGIIENRLVTSGAYAIVRNPIYSAFMFLFSGVLLINGNALTFILPFLYWLFMTALLKRTEEKWLADRFGKEYEEYCCKVNRCIPAVSDRNSIYKSDISDVVWIVYDLPGNVGWILYFAGIILSFVKMPMYMEQEWVFQLIVTAIIPALLMLVGIVELIDERRNKLDRILPRVRLMRGFGALIIGGIAGTTIGIMILVYCVIIQMQDLHCIWLLIAGGILCSVFAWLIFRHYRKD